MKESNRPGTGRSVLLMIPAFLMALTSFSQERKLPDGSIVYSDGSRRLPNGTIIYKGGNTGSGGSVITLPNGTLVYPDGQRHPEVYKGIKPIPGRRLKKLTISYRQLG